MAIENHKKYAYVLGVLPNNAPWEHPVKIIIGTSVLLLITEKKCEMKFIKYRHNLLSIINFTVYHQRESSVNSRRSAFFLAV